MLTKVILFGTFDQQFTGTIPSELGLLTASTVFNVGDNLLTGMNLHNLLLYHG